MASELFDSNLEIIKSSSFTHISAESGQYNNKNYSVYTEPGKVIIERDGARVEIKGMMPLEIVKFILESYDPASIFDEMLDRVAQYIYEKWQKLPSALQRVAIQTDNFDQLYEIYAGDQLDAVRSCVGPYRGVDQVRIDLDSRLADILNEMDNNIHVSRYDGSDYGDHIYGNLATFIPWCTSTPDPSSGHSSPIYGGPVGPYSGLDLSKIQSAIEVPSDITGDDGSVKLIINLCDYILDHKPSITYCGADVDDEAFIALCNVSKLLDTTIDKCTYYVIRYEIECAIKLIGNEIRIGGGYNHWKYASGIHSSGELSVSFDDICGPEDAYLNILLIQYAFCKIAKNCPEVLTSQYKDLTRSDLFFNDYCKEYQFN